MLAYVDDLVMVASSPGQLQKMLDVASVVANLMNLRFKPPKCGTLAVINSVVSPKAFAVQGEQIPILDWSQAYRYLGIPWGLVWTKHLIRQSSKAWKTF